ncbi:hypothetical protein pb186bvf_019108 [Paramecium bursaria]
MVQQQGVLQSNKNAQTKQFDNTKQSEQLMNKQQNIRHLQDENLFTILIIIFCQVILSLYYLDVNPNIRYIQLYYAYRNKQISPKMIPYVENALITFKNNTYPLKLCLQETQKHNQAFYNQNMKRYIHIIGKCEMNHFCQIKDDVFVRYSLYHCGRYNMIQIKIIINLSQDQKLLDGSDQQYTQEQIYDDHANFVYIIKSNQVAIFKNITAVYELDSKYPLYGFIILMNILIRKYLVCQRRNIQTIKTSFKFFMKQTSQEYRIYGINILNREEQQYLELGIELQLQIRKKQMISIESISKEKGVDNCQQLEKIYLEIHYIQFSRMGLINKNEIVQRNFDFCKIIHIIQQINHFFPQSFNPIKV